VNSWTVSGGFGVELSSELPVFLRKNANGVKIAPLVFPQIGYLFYWHMLHNVLVRFFC